jgi:hypothetical protein
LDSERYSRFTNEVKLKILRREGIILKKKLENDTFMMDTEGTVRKKESLTVEKENSIVFKKRIYTHKELRESKEAIGRCIAKNNIYTCRSHPYGYTLHI